MLINCPECGKEVSDKTEQCIHCGFPFNKKKNIEDNYVCPDCGNTTYRKRENAYEVYLFCSKCSHCTVLETKAKSPSLRCPKCLSGNITTGARGVTGFWGAIGASKTVNRCADCGCVFEPSKGVRLG